MINLPFNLKKEFLTYTLTFLLFFALGLSLRRAVGQTPLQFFGLAQKQSPTLSLLPTSGNFKEGDPLPFKVILDTKGEKITSAEIILSFDPNLAKISSGPIPGPVFSSSTSKLPPSGSGLIQWSGQGKFTGSSYLVSFTLIPLQKGELKVSFDYATLDESSVEVTPVTFQIN